VKEIEQLLDSSHNRLAAVRRGGVRDLLELCGRRNFGRHATRDDSDRLAARRLDVDDGVVLAGLGARRTMWTTQRRQRKTPALAWFSTLPAARRIDRRRQLAARPLHDGLLSVL
jgi:hypothetical protein